MKTIGLQEKFLAVLIFVVVFFKVIDRELAAMALWHNLKALFISLSSQKAQSLQPNTSMIESD